MPMTRYDSNLLNAMKRARENCASLALEDESESIRTIAVGLLEKTIHSYETAIASDSKEVAEAAESREALQIARGNLNEAFDRLRMALQMEFNRRRLADHEAEAVDQDVARYLADYPTEHFEGSSLRTAVEVLRVARAFSSLYLQEDFRGSVENETDAAIAGALSAQDSHRKEELDVVDSKSELEQARTTADMTYGTVRFLVRAALRLVDREDEISAVIPTLRQALHEG